LESPFQEGDKAKITFWGIDLNGKDCLYQCKFLPFGLELKCTCKISKDDGLIFSRFGFCQV